jgi:thiol-disulfide isomerase/thioredoxin
MLTAVGSAPAAGPVPRKASEFVILSPDGKQTLLTSYRGKSVVLALMFTTCPHCQKAAQLLSQLQKEYADRGLQVLGATFDPGAKANILQFDRIFATGFLCGYSTNENVLQFLQQPASNPPFVPILVFIDRAGMIRAQHVITGDDGPDSPEQKFFANLETNVRGEIDKLLKAGPRTSLK